MFIVAFRGAGTNCSLDSSDPACTGAEPHPQGQPRLVPAHVVSVMDVQGCPYRPPQPPQTPASWEELR